MDLVCTGVKPCSTTNDGWFSLTELVDSHFRNVFSFGKGLVDFSGSNSIVISEIISCCVEVGAPLKRYSLIVV